MNEMEKRQKIVECINGMSDDEIVALYNKYCEANRYTDDYIYNTYELDEFLEWRTPTDILCMGFYGGFNPQHNFFWLDGCGNLESADCISETPIFAEEIADYILTKEDSLENYEVQEILDDEDDDEDDENNF